MATPQPKLTNEVLKQAVATYMPHLVPSAIRKSNNLSQALVGANKKALRIK
jgi:hypothetical protein